MSEIVFILGAGASKEAGAPLMADFLDRADELRKSKREELGQFKTDFDLVFEAISALQSVHSKSELDLDNIESVFAAFEMGRTINKLPTIPGDKIAALLKSIRRLIFITLEKTVAFPVRDEKIFPGAPYDAFVGLLQLLNSAGREKRCSIITFNYDVVLDYALFHQVEGVDYCLTETTSPYSTPLLKLHGSLNWAECPKCNEIIPVTFEHYFSKRGFMSLKGLEYVNLNIGSNLSSVGLEHCGQTINSEPVIVPPTWNKAEYNKGLQSVWRRAAVELANAENIFVSGYSLPESDYFFRYLYALGSVGKARIKRFWVFDPAVGEGVRTRFQELIGKGIMSRFKFEKATFNNSIKIIRKALLG